MGFGKSTRTVRPFVVRVRGTCDSRREHGCARLSLVVVVSAEPSWVEKCCGRLVTTPKPGSASFERVDAFERSTVHFGSGATSVRPGFSGVVGGEWDARPRGSKVKRGRLKEVHC